MTALRKHKNLCHIEAFACESLELDQTIQNRFAQQGSILAGRCVNDHRM